MVGVEIDTKGNEGLETLRPFSGCRNLARNAFLSRFRKTCFCAAKFLFPVVAFSAASALSAFAQDATLIYDGEILSGGETPSRSEAAGNDVPANFPVADGTTSAGTLFGEVSVPAGGQIFLCDGASADIDSLTGPLDAALEEQLLASGSILDFMPVSGLSIGEDGSKYVSNIFKAIKFKDVPVSAGGRITPGGGLSSSGSSLIVPVGGGAPSASDSEQSDSERSAAAPRVVMIFPQGTWVYETPKGHGFMPRNSRPFFQRKSSLPLPSASAETKTASADTDTDDSETDTEDDESVANLNSVSDRKNPERLTFLSPASASFFSVASSPVVLAQDAARVEYNGGSYSSDLGFHRYNWGHSVWGSDIHFGSETLTAAEAAETTFVFTSAHQGTVAIYRDVRPGEVVIESGSYTFNPLTWEDGVWGWVSGDGRITGTGGLTVNAGASLTMHIDNSYTGDTVVAGTLITEDVGGTSTYGSGDDAFGTGALIIEQGGVVRLNGTTQSSSSVKISGTLDLGDRSSSASYNPFADASSVALEAGGNLQLSGNDVSTNLTVSGGTISAGTLSGEVSVALANGADLTLDGVRIENAISDGFVSEGSQIFLSGGSSASVDSLTVNVGGAGQAAIVLEAGSSLSLGGTLTLNVEDAMVEQMLASGGSTLDFISVSGLSAGEDASKYVTNTFTEIKINDGSRWTGVFDPTTGGIIISAVPEPAMLSLFFGMIGIFYATRRRRRSREGKSEAGI